MNKNNKINIPKQAQRAIDDLDIELANMQILGASITVFGYILLIISAEQDKLRIFQKQLGVKITAQPAQIGYEGMIFTLTGAYILAVLAKIRLEEKNIQIEKGYSKELIWPYESIVVGGIINVISNIIKIGAVKYFDDISKSEESLI